MSLIADFELGLCTRTHDHAVSSRAPNLKLVPQKTGRLRPICIDLPFSGFVGVFPEKKSS